MTRGWVDEEWARAPPREVVARRTTLRRASSGGDAVGVQLPDESRHASGDVVANLAHTFDRFALRVRQLPVHVVLSGNVRARVVTGRDDDVGPVDELLRELLRDVVAASIPSSPSASTTSGCAAAPGTLPAAPRVMAAAGFAFEEPLAITLRPPFAVQTKRTFSSASRGSPDELVRDSADRRADDRRHR